MRKLITAIATLTLAACVQTAKMSSTFNSQEAQYIKAKGKGVITGQLFLRRNDGVVVYGAGSDVILVPATAYARERMQTVYANAKFRSAVTSVNFENDDPSYREYTRSTKADGQGNFAFNELVAGTYYVVGTVTWCAPSQYGCNTQGGGLLETATLKDGDRVNLIMNGQ